ncbi:MAG: efflux RND transporter permease subunit [Deltaproteobacteria bacterium]|nr:efflux RND transporter permease subunit [Deltaproteobacteria bacterium]
MTLAALGLRHGRGVVFASIVCACAGLWVAATLPKGVYPEVSFQREQVVATLPGAAQATLLAGVTRPLEAALSSVPGVDSVRSRTIRGAVELSLFFSQDTDMAQAHTLVLSRLAEERGALPPATEVVAERVLPSSFPILSYNLEGPYPASQLFELAQYTIRPALSGLPGAGLVTVQSSDLPETQVLLDPARLRAAHLSVPAVAARLRASNHTETVARLTDTHELALGIVSGELTSTAQLAQTVVGGTPQLPVRLGDLGVITRGTAPQTTLIRVDGHPGVILNIARRASGDVVRLDAAVKTRLAELRPSLPPGVTLRPVYEQADFVVQAEEGVRDAVVFGALCSLIVLAIFLREWRSTLLAALSLPLTLGATLLVLALLHQTLNLMSLGGLAIAVGLVIDDAVVVVEAVHRHLEAGLGPREAAARGTEELFWPVVGTTLTTVVVFLPLGLLSGVAGQFFAALSISLAAAVLLSMPVALFVLPPLAAGLLRPLHRAQRPSRVLAGYERVLSLALTRPSLVLGALAAVVVLGAAASTRLETGFLPEADEGSYVIDYFAPVSLALPESDALAQHIEEVVRDAPETLSFSRRLGAELGPPVATLPSRGDVAVRLRPGRRGDIEDLMNEQRKAIAARAPGLRVEFVQVLADMLGDLEGSAEPIEVRLFGPDPEVLRALAAQVAARIQDIPGVVDLFNGDEGCVPQLDFKLDPVRAGRLGLDATAVSDQLAGAMLGEVATSLRLPDHLEDVRVLSRASTPAPEPKDLRGQTVLTSDGALVPLASLGELVRSCPPAASLRMNQRNLVHLTARLSGAGLGSVSKEIKARLSSLALPQGYTWELGGLVEQQQESFRSLLLVLVLALAAVATVLLFQLRSFISVVAVLAAAPVSLAGGAIALWLSGTALNVSSLMGSILLVGLMVKNGILLLEHARGAEERGLSLGEALREAARDRLRPILMTTLATLAALLPLLVGLGSGAGLHRPLAVVVVGGLAFSTAATLVVVPALTTLLRRRWREAPRV